MTDKEKLEAIRAEIERRKKLHEKSLINPIHEGFGLQNVIKAKISELTYLLSFIDSMQEEPKYKFKVGDKVMPKRFTDNECGFYIDNSARIVDIVGDYYILEGDKAYKIACQDNWELVEKTVPRRSKVKDREATGKLKECIDNITDESLAKAHKQLQEEPKECVYSKGNYTDEDRKALCDSCEEECKFNKKEEPVSEDLEEAVNAYIGYAPEVDESSSTYGKRQAFKAGANWKEQQLVANAVDGFVIEDIEEGNGDFLLSTEYLSKDMGLKDRQKVKVIVIRED